MTFDLVPEAVIEDGFQALAAGDFRKALAAFDQVDAALDDWESESPAFALTFVLVATQGYAVACGAGRYDRALVFAQRQLDIAERSGDQGFLRSRALNNRGLAQLELGRHVQAEADLHKALSILDFAATSHKPPGDEEDLRQTIIDNLNSLRSLQNRPPIAGPRRLGPVAEGAWFTSARKGDADLRVVNNAFFAARTAEAEGDLLEATEILKRCVADLGPGAAPKAAGIALSNLGNAFLKEGATDQAVQTLQESVRLLEGLIRPSEPLALALHALGEAQLRSLNLEAAAETAKAAWIEIDAAAPDTPQALMILQGLAKMRVCQRDFDRARAALKHAASLYNSNRAHFAATEEGHSGSFATFRSQTELMLLVAIHDQFPDEALDWMERGKGRFWEERAKTRVEPPDVDSCAGPGGYIGLAGLVGEPNRLVLTYFVGANFSFRVAVVNQLVAAHRIDLTASELASLVEAFRGDLHGPGQSEQTAGEALSRLLLDDLPLQDAPSASLEAVIVAPDGPLWNLPFDVLPASNGAVTLSLRDIPLSMTPTLRIWRQLRLKPRADFDRQRVLIVSRTRYEGYADIPHADREAADIKAKAAPRRVERLVEDAATPAAVTQAIIHADVIHIASHAVAGDHVTPSAIVLAGSEGADARLTIDEIETLRLKAQVVFLSSCSSALGKMSEGEGLASLARAFLFAGVRCVVASLWPVDDGVTAMFVGYFYESLFGGHAPEVALFAAKSRALREGLPIFAVAGFQLIGDGAAQASLGDLSRRLG